MSKIVWVQKAKGNKAQTWLGSQGQVKLLFSIRWYCVAEGNEPQHVFQKPGWGKVNPGQILLGSRRPRETRYSETTLLYMLVPWSWGKCTPTSFEKPGWGKVNRGQILFGSRRPREKRHILGLSLKAEWNDSSPHVGAVKLRETNPNKFWRNQAEGK